LKNIANWDYFEILKYCVIIPTYNNEKTLSRVIDGILKQDCRIKPIVVNDGSTDGTLEILTAYKGQIELISYDENQGKGKALRQGFKRAIELGYDNAITIDSDGQHFPVDIPNMLKVASVNPGAVIMGSRNMNQEGVPSKSSFGNKFSNFWFRVETFIKLPDTQTGFRFYPLRPISKMRFFTKKFEFEIEVIVRLAWRDIPFVSVPVKVLYDADERVSHFRPFKDFMRISVLNTILVTLCLFYFYPKRLFSVKTLKLIKQEAIKPEESNLSKSFSIAFGCFMGVTPIWGAHMLVGMPIAIVLKMNKVLFIGASNISIPPMIPFIIYLSLIIGQLVMGQEINKEQIWETSYDSIKGNLFTYIVGSLSLAMILFLVSFGISYSLLSVFRKGK
jgi:glycosyltransferase involved in cell wall biosynthesis